MYAPLKQSVLKSPLGLAKGLLKGVSYKQSQCAGLKVCTEHHAGEPSTCLGVYVRVGSCFDPPGKGGMGHFLEHMLFKGAGPYSAYDLVAKVEAQGGEINAFTDKEHTGFYVHMLNTDIAVGVDVLLSMVFDARLSKLDIEQERKVVLQEIASNNESFDELIFDMGVKKYCSKSPLGKDVLGSKASVTNISISDIKAFYKKHYVPQNMVLCAVGGLRHKRLLSLVRKKRKLIVQKSAPKFRFKKLNPVTTSAFVKAVAKPATQSHALFMWQGPGLIFNKKDIHKMACVQLLNTLLGGGMTSVLYQSIREQKGLAYSIYSDVLSFSSQGMWFVYADFSAPRLKELCEGVVGEVEKLKTHINTQSCQFYKKQLIKSFSINFKNWEERASYLGASQLFRGRHIATQEHLEALIGVEESDLRQVAREYLSKLKGLLIVGKQHKNASVCLSKIKPHLCRTMDF